MKYFVVAPFSLKSPESVTGRVIIEVGQVLELSLDQAARLAGKIEVIPHPNGGRNLSHYCEPGDCWCSAKLPDRDYPAGCQRVNCEHYHGGPNESS